MEEKILVNKKNGMAFLLLFIILYAAAIAGFVFSLILLETWHSWAPITLLIISSVWRAGFPSWVSRSSSPRRRWFSPFSDGTWAP